MCHHNNQLKCISSSTCIIFTVTVADDDNDDAWTESLASADYMTHIPYAYICLTEIWAIDCWCRSDWWTISPTLRRHDTNGGKYYHSLARVALQCMQGFRYSREKKKFFQFRGNTDTTWNQKSAEIRTFFIKTTLMELFIYTFICLTVIITVFVGNGRVLFNNHI